MFWLAPPVRLQLASNQPSNEECLTLADQDGSAKPQDLNALERCSAVLADDVELMADLGQAYEAADRQGDAEAIYRRVLTIDHDYADVRGRLAALLLRRGEAAEARQHAEEALRVQPNRRSLQAIVDQASRPTSQRTP